VVGIGKNAESQTRSGPGRVSGAVMRIAYRVMPERAGLPRSGFRGCLHSALLGAIPEHADHRGDNADGHQDV
jgi:hypothetical protein